MICADMTPPAGIVCCQPRKPSNAREYWSWREKNSRPCWYAGRPGKPKDELRWCVSSQDEPPEGKGAESVATPPQSRDGLPPAFQTIQVRPIAPGDFEDRWLGFMRCRYLITGNWNC